jgi:hypothetical protein
MKNIILFYNLAITAMGCAQSKDKKVVPKVVKRLFKKNIQIMKVAWDIEKTVLKQSLKLNGKGFSNTIKLTLAIEIEIKEIVYQPADLYFNYLSL